MHHNNRINGYFSESTVEQKPTEGNCKGLNLDREPHEELAGHVIHVLSPEQAARLPDHEAAKLFPTHPADLKRLKESIRQFGQQIPIVLYEGQVLDGRSRKTTCAELEIPVQAVRFSHSDLNGLSPKQWVLHRNRTVADGRRMTDAEYALIVAIAYGAEESERASLRQKQGVRLDTELCGETSKVLGTTFNVSGNLLKQALKLFKSGDENLIQMVKDKKLSLSRAADILRLPEAQRKAALQDPRRPLPLTSPEDVVKAFSRALKTLDSAEKRVREIATSEHFSVTKRTEIQPTLTKLCGAISELLESPPDTTTAISES